MHIHSPEQLAAYTNTTVAEFLEANAQQERFASGSKVIFYPLRGVPDDFMCIDPHMFATYEPCPTCRHAVATFHRKDT